MYVTQQQSLEAALKVKLVEVGCPLELRRSRRARRFSLKVSHTERAAILTLPEEVKFEEAGHFLSRHMDWLKRQIDRLPKPIPFEDGAIIPLRGIAHKINFVGAVRYQGVVWVEESDCLAETEQWDADLTCSEKIRLLTLTWTMRGTFRAFVFLEASNTGRGVLPTGSERRQKPISCAGPIIMHLT